MKEQDKTQNQIDNVQKVGPNGFRTEYTKEGDLVEWIPDEDNPGEEWSLLIRRSDNAIGDAHRELWDKVWYNRHANSNWVDFRIGPDGSLMRAEKRLPEMTKKLMRQVEEKYGKEILAPNDYEFGLLTGRLSALAWVMGAEWEGSMDT
jgi:hypothetical protein